MTTDSKKKISIKWWDGKKGYCEIYQQTGMHFAFLTAPDENKTFSMCHNWAKCRDFLHDAVRTEISGAASSIYGFAYTKGKNPSLDLKRMRMLVTLGNFSGPGKTAAEFRNKMRSSLKLLHHFESRMGVSLSRMIEMNAEGSGKEVVMMFTSSPTWLKSPFLVSMYTFLIRLGDKELEYKDEKTLRESLKKLNETTSNDNDARYLKASWDKLHLIVDHRSGLFPEKDGFHDIFFDSGIKLGNFHNNCGVYSLASFNTPVPKLNDLMRKLVGKGK